MEYMGWTAKGVDFPASCFRTDGKASFSSRVRVKVTERTNIIPDA